MSFDPRVLPCEFRNLFTLPRQRPSFNIIDLSGVDLHQDHIVSSNQSPLGTDRRTAPTIQCL